MMQANDTVFNYPKEGYWRDRDYRIEFQVPYDRPGIDKKDMT